MSLPEPTATGELARTPFAHALLSCHQRALSGTLVLWPESAEPGQGQDRILFAAGVPVAARLRAPAVALDRSLLPLFARAGGQYAFYSDTDLVGEGDHVLTGRVDPLALLAASLRGPSRDDAVEAVLGAYEGAIRFRPGTVDLKRLALLPKEIVFVDVVRAAPGTIAELAPQCELGELSGRRLLYLLAITQSLEAWTPAEEPAPAAPPGPVAEAKPAARPAEAKPAARPGPVAEAKPAARPGPVAEAKPAARPAAEEPKRAGDEEPPAPPADLAAELKAQWTEIAARAVAMERETYFDMLGIARDVGTDAVRKAYFGLVKRWHPDRVPPELAPVRPWAERIFRRLTEAHETLADETKRAAYTRQVSDGGGTPESDRKLAAIVQAAMDQQKADFLLRRKDYEGAIAKARSAVDMNPEDEDGWATLAWALHLRGQADDRKEMAAAIERALTMNPRNDRAQFYHATMLRKAGKDAEAVAAFAAAAEINPKNTDAVREVRLAQMRSLPRAPQTPAPGILSKLFGGLGGPSKR